MNARFSVYANMLKEMGVTLTPTTRILDFGCGSGELVKAAYETGLQAYGCDIDFSSEWIEHGTLAHLRATGKVREIQRASVGKVSPGAGEGYRLPFDDNTFDVIISDQVFEHVRNYGEVLSELARVGKPGAAMLHIFPARYRLIEGHIGVPLACFFRPRWWLWLWARLGVRNEYQRGLSVAETVKRNGEFLAQMTNYLSMRRSLQSSGAISRRWERKGRSCGRARARRYFYCLRCIARFSRGVCLPANCRA